MINRRTLLLSPVAAYLPALPAPEALDYVLLEPTIPEPVFIKGPYFFFVSNSWHEITFTSPDDKVYLDVNGLVIEYSPP